MSGRSNRYVGISFVTTAPLTFLLNYIQILWTWYIRIKTLELFPGKEKFQKCRSLGRSQKIQRAAALPWSNTQLAKPFLGWRRGEEMSLVDTSTMHLS